MTVRVLITRPRREAQAWAQRLSRLGHKCELLPLIEIVPAADESSRQALQAAWQGVDSLQAIMFVSANAAEHFFAGGLAQTIAAPSTSSAATAGQQLSPVLETSCRFWVTGAGTRAALQAHGVPPERIDGPSADSLQFDSEALWTVVQGQVQPGAQVLIVRGADALGEPAGRDWLAQQLRNTGAKVRTVVSYRRILPSWSEAQRTLAAQASEGADLWLFNSSEAIANLCTLMPGQRWSRARAIATHPRIAQAARDAGFGRVWTTRPSLDDLIASIKSAHVQD